VNGEILQIGKSLRADEEPSPELSAYKLSAGFAIGLICLGLGDEIAAARPPFKQPLPSIPDRLLALMLGGPRGNQCVFIHPQLITCPDVNTATPTPPQESRSNHVRIPSIIHEYAQTVLKFPSKVEVDITDKEMAYWDEVVDTVAKVYNSSRSTEYMVQFILNQLAHILECSHVNLDLSLKFLCYKVLFFEFSCKTLQVYLYAMTAACFAMALKNQCVFIHPQLITCPDVNTATPTPPQESRSNHVREGPNVNVHMTAHPATIALGLMYMRTGNTAIARELELPATISMLEEIRPDVIPSIIHEYAQTVLKFPSKVEVDITDKEMAYWDEVVDRETVAEVYLYAMTAACFAMALKYSGTIGEKQENEERMQFLMHDFNIESIDWPARHMIRAANRSVVNLCADMMLLSMAILNVGRGKIETIRFARYRRSHDYELSYWSHHPWKFHEEMSVHRALAMLFLGEGRLVDKLQDWQ
ncbi:hypothetical protein OSTOST_09711, partial [Ostertagia ostertagi]